MSTRSNKTNNTLCCLIYLLQFSKLLNISTSIQHNQYIHTYFSPEFSKNDWPWTFYFSLEGHWDFPRHSFYWRGRLWWAPASLSWGGFCRTSSGCSPGRPSDGSSAGPPSPPLCSTFPGAWSLPGSCSVWTRGRPPPSAAGTGPVCCWHSAAGCWYHPSLPVKTHFFKKCFIPIDRLCFLTFKPILTTQYLTLHIWTDMLYFFHLLVLQYIHINDK